MEYVPFANKKDKFKKIFKVEYKMDQERNRIYDELNTKEEKKKFSAAHRGEFNKYMKLYLDYMYSDVNPNEKLIWKNFILLIHRQHKPKNNLKETIYFLKQLMNVTQEMINDGLPIFSETDYLNALDTHYLD